MHIYVYTRTHVHVEHARARTHTHTGAAAAGGGQDDEALPLAKRYGLISEGERGAKDAVVMLKDLMDNNAHAKNNVSHNTG